VVVTSINLISRNCRGKSEKLDRKEEEEQRLETGLCESDRLFY
jgi:hypothetical protein